MLVRRRQDMATEHNNGGELRHVGVCCTRGRHDQVTVASFWCNLTLAGTRQVLHFAMPRAQRAAEDGGFNGEF